MSWILIVEDDRAVLGMVERVLLKEGLRTAGVGSGIAASEGRPG